MLDETYATTQLTRLRGRSRRGVRLVAHVPHGHWRLLTVLAAVTVGGVLAAATVEAATDGDAFRAFVDDVLVPALRPGMVVVMDNLSAHKVAGVASSIAAAGCRVEYLPPYSPDLSPIEPVFAKLKPSLRTTAARGVLALQAAIGLALESITPGDCHGCFAGCGYTLHLK